MAKLCTRTHVANGGKAVISGQEILAQTYHFIFMDIVGFSKRGISATNQVSKIQTLNTVVTGARAFTSARRSSLVILPTGDGMAIGFRDSCESGPASEHKRKGGRTTSNPAEILTLKRKM